MLAAVGDPEGEAVAIAFVVALVDDLGDPGVGPVGLVDDQDHRHVGVERVDGGDDAGGGAVTLYLSRGEQEFDQRVPAPHDAAHVVDHRSRCVLWPPL